MTDNGKGFSDPGALFGAAGALVTGVGALALTGTLGRVQRNDGTGFAISLGLVVAGALAWVVAAVVGPKPRTYVKLGGAISVGAGVVLGFIVAIKASTTIEQPSVTLRLSDDGESVVATARAGDLGSDARLNVFVDGLRLARKGKHATATNGQPKDIYGTPTILYEAYVGPNGDGEATEDVRVAIPPTRFDAIDIRAFTANDAAECSKAPLNLPGHRGTGCAIIELPAPPAAPELSASLDPSAKSNVVKITLRASRVSDGKLALLQAVGGGHREAPTTLYRATNTATPAGTVSRAVSLPVPPHLGIVCVDAQFAGPRRTFPTVACPQRPQPGVSAVELHIPER
jgi:hypothetical protein